MKCSKPFFLCLLTVVIFLSASGLGSATSLSLTQLQNLTNPPDGGEAEYGPQSAARFSDGPVTVLSGTTVDLLAGPKKAQNATDDLLFVISVLEPGFLGTINFNLEYKDSLGSFSAFLIFDDDFYSTTAIGFPSNIGGIGFGEVNNIKFPDALHAGVLVPWVFSEKQGVDSVIGNVTVTSPVSARVDIFGVAAGSDPRIINNTPNSRALGIPEPATMLLLGAGLIGMAAIGRKKFRKK